MRLEKTAQVVIGAQFGDEGKGRLIDHYATLAGGDSIVIRFNGGAQAGHTVVTPEGQRHIFSHVGSGAFAGAATFLSRFFVANPILLLKEMKRLAEWGRQRRVRRGRYLSVAVLCRQSHPVAQGDEEAGGMGRHTNRPDRSGQSGDYAL